MRRTHRHSGFVMMAAVLAMVILLAIGGGLLAIGLQSRIYQIRTAAEITARCAADCGMAKAVYELNALYAVDDLDELPAETDVSLPGVDARYSYTVTEADGEYTIASTGYCGVGQHTVYVTMGAAANPYDFAILTQSDMILRNSVVIDGYNFAAGDDPLRIGTNSITAGAVDLGSSITVAGDILVGPGGNPDVVIETDHDVSIQGDTYAQGVLSTPPSITVPSPLVAAASHGTIENNLTVTSSGKYDSINLGNSEQLTISGHVELYITGSINLGNGAKIELDESNPDSSLTLYLDGQLITGNSSEINNATAEPSKLRILGTDSCTTLDFRNSATMYGVLYAPNADVVFHNSIDIYGLLIGESVEMKNSATILYDASLRSLGDEIPPTLGIVRWRE